MVECGSKTVTYSHIDDSHIAHGKCDVCQAEVKTNLLHISKKEGQAIEDNINSNTKESESK